jgi:hypothetical protein
MHTCRLIICCGVAALVACGCVIWPTTSERSPEVQGRVVDSVTALPVPNATVALHEHPSIKARSDDKGAYRIRATHNFHLIHVLGICGDEYPVGNYYRADELDVSHPLYEGVRIQARQFSNPPYSHEDTVVLRDISLVPKPKP